MFAATLGVALVVETADLVYVVARICIIGVAVRVKRVIPQYVGFYLTTCPAGSTPVTVIFFVSGRVVEIDRIAGYVVIKIVGLI